MTAENTSQPATPHYCFDRPLHILFNACFRAGLVLNGLEELAFSYPHDGSQPRRLLSWNDHHEIPLLWWIAYAFPIDHGRWLRFGIDQHT